MRMIEIDVIGKGKALAKLDDRNSKIRESFFRALPIEGIANLWGEEVYFDVPLQMENENPSPSATAGDICYWSQGPAFCIFFGKTQPYSAVKEDRNAGLLLRKQEQEAAEGPSERDWRKTCIALPKMQRGVPVIHYTHGGWFQGIQARRRA